MRGTYLLARTRQPTRRGHPPTPPRRVNVGQSEPSDPPVFPLPDAGGFAFGWLRTARDGQLAVALHLGADRSLVRPAVQIRIRVEQRCRGVVERLAARVHELGREVFAIDDAPTER